MELQQPLQADALSMTNTLKDLKGITSDRERDCYHEV